MPNNNTAADTSQTTIPFSSPDETQLDISTLETWLWDAACVIRGATDAPKFKDFILPLIFYKHLSDVFDDEVANLVGEYGGDEEGTWELIDADHQDALKTRRKKLIVRFYIPDKYRWKTLCAHPANGRLGEFVTEAMREVARLNPPLQGVLAVSLAKAGASVVEMQIAGRWKSSQMPAHYAKAELAERGAIARFKKKKSR